MVKHRYIFMGTADKPIRGRGVKNRLVGKTRGSTGERWATWGSTRRFPWLRRK